MGARVPWATAMTAGAALAAWVAACPGAMERLVFSGRGGVDRPLSEILPDLRAARFVFVGESHDNRDHHRAQLEIVRALQQSGASVAVGLEMFRADAQPQLDRWVGGQLSRKELFALYSDHWDLRFWPLYADLFTFARDHRVPLVALNLPREIVSRVAREGFAALPEEARRDLGAVECNVDPEYQRLLGLLLGITERSAPRFLHFCEAQVVWDVAMAKRLLAYAGQNPGRTVVVLAGVFHAWRPGIPDQIARRSTLPTRIILPAHEEALADYGVALRDADYVWSQR